MGQKWNEKLLVVQSFSAFLFFPPPGRSPVPSLNGRRESWVDRLLAWLLTLRGPFTSAAKAAAAVPTEPVRKSAENCLTSRL